MAIKVKPWLEDELILLFETIWNTCFSFGFPEKDILFCVLFIWVPDEIWNSCFGFWAPEKDKLLVEGWILDWWLIWNICLGLCFPSKENPWLDEFPPWWLELIWKTCLALFALINSGLAKL